MTGKSAIFQLIKKSPGSNKNLFNRMNSLLFATWRVQCCFYMTFQCMPPQHHVVKCTKDYQL